MMPPLTPELLVRDFERSLDFYVHTLGFEVMFGRPENKFASVARNGAWFMIEQITGLEKASDEDFVKNHEWRTGNLEYPFGRACSFQIQVPDVDRMYRRIQERAYPIKSPLEERSFRVNDSYVRTREFLLLDPDGFLLRFQQELSR